MVRFWVIPFLINNSSPVTAQISDAYQKAMASLPNIIWIKNNPNWWAIPTNPEASGYSVRNWFGKVYFSTESSTMGKYQYENISMAILQCS